jgi:hypothetical protein
MVSISDLGNGGKPGAVIGGGLTPDEQSVLSAEYAAQARVATVMQGVLDQDAQIASVISGKIPTRLDRRPEDLGLPTLSVEQSPAIALLHEEAAHARAAREQASRPWWKTSGGWSLIIAFAGLLIAIPAGWPAIEAWCIAAWGALTFNG